MRATSNKDRHGLVLLTGATGFVGKRLLEELLSETEQTVVCLVRADSALQAQRRGEAIGANRRALFLPADLEAKRMGLDSVTWAQLSEQLTEIYHCAASVNFDLSLGASRQINVAGTRRLLELAQAAQANGTFKRFHHVSTAYAAGLQRGPVDAAFLPDDHPRNFRNNYERSKAEAERMLRLQTDVAVSIYRPSIVCGDSRTGVTDNFNVVYVPMRLINKGSMPQLLRGGQGLVDCVGVDYVARGIVALGKSANHRIENYHLTAGEPFTIDDLARTAVKTTRLRSPRSHARCATVGRPRWELMRLLAALASRLPRRLRRTRQWGQLVTRGLRNFQPYEPYCSVDTQFVCAGEQALLAARDITHPPQHDYLRIITQYAVDSCFGTERASESSGETPAEPAGVLSSAAA